MSPPPPLAIREQLREQRFDKVWNQELNDAFAAVAPYGLPRHRLSARRGVSLKAERGGGCRLELHLTEGVRHAMSHPS